MNIWDRSRQPLGSPGETTLTYQTLGVTPLGAGLLTDDLNVDVKFHFLTMKALDWKGLSDFLALLVNLENPLRCVDI